MADDKHSDLPASERHLGWAISALVAGAEVGNESFESGTRWKRLVGGRIVWSTNTCLVDLSVWSNSTGFYIYEPELDDAPELTYGERIVALEAECRALRELVKGEFSALSARITEVSRMTRSVAPAATGTIGGVDLSKLR